MGNEQMTGLGSTWVLIIGIFVVALMIAALVFLIIQKTKKAKFLDAKLKIIENVTKIESFQEVDEQYTETLKLLSTLIKGEGYFLYVYETQHNRYRLERVLFAHADQDVQNSGIQVSYGRIMPYAKESYAPPLVFPEATIPDQSKLLMEGRHAVLVIPINGYGFLSVSFGKKKPSFDANTMDFLRERMEKTFLRFKEKKAEAPDEQEAEQEPKDEQIEKAFESVLQIIGAQSGFYLTMQNDYCEWLMERGIDDSVKEALGDHAQLYPMFDGISKKETLTMINESQDMYTMIPESLKQQGWKSFVVLKNAHGILIGCHKEHIEQEYDKEYRVDACNLLLTKTLERMKRVKTAHPVEYYRKKLYEITDKMDQEEPYTVVYAGLMERYATVIAKELHMSDEDVQVLKQAAYLSNIGTLQLKESVLRKRGIYSEEEYEAVKKHSEDGASLVRFLLEDEPVANAILYHHERMDGKGYPLKIKGDEIPLSAKILATVQRFLSKIKGRNYREPLTYEKIISFIESESENALDPEVVNTLLIWFKKKQENPIFKGKTLGPCWEMRCASPSICSGCPAYKQTDRYCWEIDGTLCELHGNECSTCYVYTEFIYRQSVSGASRER